MAIVMNEPQGAVISNCTFTNDVPQQAEFVFEVFFVVKAGAGESSFVVAATLLAPNRDVAIVRGAQELIEGNLEVIMVRVRQV